jgi:hypothetical protein
MPQTTTLLLFPETAYQNPGNGAPYTLTGESRPAAAYYLGNQDLQTVNIKTSNCTANIVIQATLAATPTENDWSMNCQSTPMIRQSHHHKVAAT